MKSVDSIYGVAKKKPAPAPMMPRNSPAAPGTNWQYFYKALQVVLTFWMVTVLAIITQPWLDYWVKSAIKSQTGLPTTVIDNSQSAVSGVNQSLSQFFLKNAQVEIKAPIVEGIDDEALKKGIGHHPDSVWPDQKGNVVLAGHNFDLDAENPYGQVFISLRLVDVGDEVEITYQGKKYIYQVFKKETVSPKDESLFGQMDDWILTFYTCDPPYTDWKRLVFQAKLVRIE
jgi:LPXTG-site transpeptidase (sortase) family protein